MSPEVGRQDLIVLVADKNMESAIQGILTRCEETKVLLDIQRIGFCSDTGLMC